MNFKLILPAIGAVALLAAASSAMAAEWKLDPAHSTLGFAATQTGAAFQGKFERYTAAISFDAERPEDARIVVTVDVGSARSGDAQRDSSLPEADWFDTKHFPQAVFKADTVRRTASGYEAAGTLTMRGVSLPVTLPFTLDINGATAHAKGHLSLLRTAYGIGQGSWASDQYVGLDVGVDIDITAVRGN